MYIQIRSADLVCVWAHILKSPAPFEVKVFFSLFLFIFISYSFYFSQVSWKRRWFVFDRKLRALCYYANERQTKTKGILYFQSIQEVYVDSTIKRSPNPRTTFCVRTPTRPYILSAPSAIAMSVWIDVVCTGKEGVFLSMGMWPLGYSGRGEYAIGNIFLVKFLDSGILL